MLKLISVMAAPLQALLMGGVVGNDLGGDIVTQLTGVTDLGMAITYFVIAGVQLYTLLKGKFATPQAKE